MALGSHRKCLVCTHTGTESRLNLTERGLRHGLRNKCLLSLPLSVLNCLCKTNSRVCASSARGVAACPGIGTSWDTRCSSRAARPCGCPGESEGCLAARNPSRTRGTCAVSPPSAWPCGSDERPTARTAGRKPRKRTASPRYAAAGERRAHTGW